MLIEPNSEEWDFMWKQVAEHSVNKGVADPYSALNGENKWKYLGSSMNDLNEIVHSFKHKLHPNTEESYYLPIIGTKNLDEKNIRLKLKI